MSPESPARLRVLRACIGLVAAFDVFALLVLLWASPQIFTLFMFLGQPLFALALILLVGAVIADLRKTELL